MLAFVSTAIRHHSCETRNYRRQTISLSELIKIYEGKTVPLGETISEDIVEIRTARRQRSPEEQTQLRMDVSLVLSKLPEDLRQVAEHLQIESIKETAQSLGLPRSRVYGAIRRLRSIFEDANLKDYLEDSATDLSCAG